MLRPPYARYETLHVYHLDHAAPAGFDDPDLIGAWEEAGCHVLFFHQNKDTLVAELCRGLGCSVVYQATLGYNAWECGQAVGRFTVKDLTVAPVWDPGPAEIMLDPSVVFGNGFHPTTRFCLYSLATLVEEAGPFDSALDLGCGSGLLAIAAARRGCQRVTAVDYNGLACRVAEANVARNGATGQVSVQQLDLGTACPDATGVDLVMANLDSPLLLRLFETPGFWAGRFHILSGFLADREAELLAAFPHQDHLFVDRQRLGRWGAWVIRRRDTAFPRA